VTACRTARRAGADLRAVVTALCAAVDAVAAAVSAIRAVAAAACDAVFTALPIAFPTTSAERVRLSAAGWF
jgi:hypothetical protein